MPLDPAVNRSQILPPPEETADAQNRNAFDIFDDFGIEVIEEGELVDCSIFDEHVDIY